MNSAASMITPPLKRAELAEKLGVAGKELTAAIREMKHRGKVIQRRISAGPLTTKKMVVFHFVATNLNLEV